MEKGKFKEASNAYIQAIKYNEDNAELCYDLGIAYTFLNEFSLAKSCFEKVIQNDSNNINAQYRLGQIALLYRDIEAAEKFFLASIYGETEGKAYYQLSKIYIIKNDKNKATIFINKAIDFDYKYYNIANNEPIFFSIKNQIEKGSSDKKGIEETPKEKKISDYLDNTYNLTKVLNEKENKKNN